MIYLRTRFSESLEQEVTAKSQLHQKAHKSFFIIKILGIKYFVRVITNYIDLKLLVFKLSL